MIGLGTVINMGLIIGGSIIGLTCGRPIYEGQFKTNPYGSMWYHRAVTRDERGYAIYAGYR